MRASRWGGVNGSSVQHRFDDLGAGLSGLRDSQRASPMGEKRGGDTGENEAPEDSHRQSVFGNLLVPCTVGDAKDNMLHLVVHSLAYLEGIGLWIRG